MKRYRKDKNEIEDKSYFANRYNVVHSKFVEFLIPSLLYSLFNGLIYFVNMFMVYYYCGIDMICAMQLADPIIYYISILYILIGVGGSLCVCRLKTKNKSDEANNVFTVSILFIVLLSVTATITINLFPNFIISILCWGSNYEGLVKEYLILISYGFPFASTMFGLSYFQRNDGFAKFPLLCISVYCIVNLSVAFILLNSFNMTIHAIGYAFDAGYIVAFLVSLLYFKKRRRSIRFVAPQNIWKTFIKIISDGLPSAAIPIFNLISLFIMNYLFLSFGDIVFIVYSLFNLILVLPTIFVNSFAQSLMPICAVCYSNSECDTLKHLYKTVLTIILSIVIILDVILLINDQSIIVFLNITLEQTTINKIVKYISILFLSFPLMSIVTYLIYYLQAIEKNIQGLLICFIDNCLTAIILLLIFSSFHNAYILCYFYAFKSILTIIVYIFYAQKKYNNIYLLDKKTRNNLIVFVIKAKEIISKSQLNSIFIKFLYEYDYISALLFKRITNHKDIKYIEVLIDYNNNKVLIRDNGVLDCYKDKQIQTYSYLGFSVIETYVDKDCYGQK